MFDCPSFLTNGHVIQFAYKVGPKPNSQTEPCYYLFERCVRSFIIPHKEEYETFELFYSHNDHVQFKTHITREMVKTNGDIHITFSDTEFDPSIAPEGIAIRINEEYFYHGILKIDGGAVLVQYHDGATHYFPNRPCDKMRAQMLRRWGRNVLP